MLKERVSDPKDIVGILSRYAKEAKRIRLDLKQEREKKLLGIRHRLETELSEVISGEAEWQFITRLAASAFPDSYSIAMRIRGTRQNYSASTRGRQWRHHESRHRR